MSTVPNLSVRRICQTDVFSLHEYARRNRQTSQEWEPLRDESYFSMYSTAGRVANMLTAQDNGSAVHFVILQGNTIIGCINYTNIVRGVFMACHLGFSIDKEFEGKGAMYQSLKVTLEHVQSVLKLHRVMANYMPHNKRSERLLERSGFKREGYAEKYLKINGKWEDHVLTSLIFDGV